MEKTTKPRLRKIYDEQVRSRLKNDFNLGNVMQIPRLKKITVNMGLGVEAKDKRHLAAHTDELSKITSQKPMLQHARKSAATFKLRQGDPVGLKVTLRGERMWYFLDKLVNVAIPRIRDFNGIKPGFDRRGNFTFGLTDQTIFPEVKIDKVTRQQGMDVCLTISGGSDDLSRAMLEGLGFPLKRKAQAKGKA
ncbi:MAG: 50S ribosomal protein L5 [Planctomycetes bacterium]|nr:50S ribosomal protein L5 [Planctomycetota bacterium]NUQ34668.1 50S ribosomal protein L5 [Planctomycetaceae bacterium]